MARSPPKTRLVEGVRLRRVGANEWEFTIHYGQGLGPLGLLPGLGSSRTHDFNLKKERGLGWILHEFDAQIKDPNEAFIGEADVESVEDGVRYALEGGTRQAR